MITYAPIRLGVYPYETPLDSVGSDSDALERAIHAVISGDSKSTQILFNGPLTLTRPPPVLDRVHIIGDDIAGSVVLKKYPGGVLWNFGGRVGYSGGGLHNFAIPTMPGCGGGYTILGRARPDGYAPDSLRLESLYVGSGANPADQPWRNLELYGYPRTSPIGIRGAVLQDLIFFGATSNIVFDSLVSCDVENIGVFPAPFTDVCAATVIVQNCIETDFTGLNIDGPLIRHNNVGCSFTAKDGKAIGL